MHAIAVHPSGAIFIADAGNNRVRRIDPSGTVTTFARSERTEVDKNGRPIPDYDVYAVNLTPDRKQLILTELVTRRISALDVASGKSRPIAGNGKRGVPVDGAPALEAPLVDPRCAAADSKGNVYVLERGGNALRVVDRKGRIRTLIAADSPVGLKGPKFVAVDSKDRVLITDCEKHRILRYDPATGQTATIAGSGERGGDLAGGDPLKAQLNRPHGAVEGPDGAIYISDSDNHRVLKLVTGEARRASKR
jgi:DNA-binding beta-propeller fold protein YncE